MNIKLVRPTAELKKQAIDFRQEFFDHDEMIINGSELLDKTDDYDEWLKAVTANTKMETVNHNLQMKNLNFPYFSRLLEPHIVK